jgi:hypothetical protein
MSQVHGRFTLLKRVLSKSIRFQSTAGEPGRDVSSEHLRNAQAAEIFRSSFFRSKNRESQIPLEDLDQLISKDQVRPSILINAYEVTGFGLGMLSRFAPESVSSFIAQSVDDAVVQQLNDSIRKMQLDEVENIDLKETLKYHRDLRGHEGDAAGDVSGSQPSPPGSSESGFDSNGKIALSSVIYHALKCSEKY